MAFCIGSHEVNQVERRYADNVGSVFINFRAAKKHGKCVSFENIQSSVSQSKVVKNIEVNLPSQLTGFNMIGQESEMLPVSTSGKM